MAVAVAEVGVGRIGLFIPFLQCFLDLNSIPLCLRWTLEPETFRRNFGPMNRPEVTHLLYEISWGRSLKTWKNLCTNDRNHHAETNFLENVWSESIKHYHHKNTSCRITWFLSWSPCHSCSDKIIEFLAKHPKVTLEIRVAQLFKVDEECNQEGLRNMVENGVKIAIMNLPGKLMSSLQRVSG